MSGPAIVVGLLNSPVLGFMVKLRTSFAPLVAVANRNSGVGGVGGGEVEMLPGELPPPQAARVCRQTNSNHALRIGGIGRLMVPQPSLNFRNGNITIPPLGPPKLSF